MTQSYPTQEIRRRDRAIATIDRASRSAAYAIIDEALILHLAFVDGGLAYAMPMAFARVGDALYLHGSPLTRIQKALASGIPVSATFTLLDGLVLAKTAFLHSMNYRGVVAFGHAVLVSAEEEKYLAFDALTEKLVPGRGKLLRRPSAVELSATSLVRIDIEQYTCKVKSGPPREPAPGDDIEGFVGVVPIQQMVDWDHAISVR